MKRFEMKDLTNKQEGMKFLGIQISFTENGITLSQEELTEKLVSKFGLIVFLFCKIWYG
jgi:hypothetical protein